MKKTHLHFTARGANLSRWRSVAGLCLVLMMALAPAMARDTKDRQRGQELEEAIRSVKHHTRGQILSAKTHQGNKSRYHKIRVLTPDGRVKNMRLPARQRPPAPPAGARSPARNPYPPQKRDDDEHDYR